MSEYVGYSKFDLSYSKKTMCDFGQLVPVMCDEVVPGDVVSLGCQLLVESAPTVDVVQHDVNIDVYYYFVAYRHLDKNWEQFIKGGLHGLDIGKTRAPRYIPGTFEKTLNANTDLSLSLWVQFGFPKLTTDQIDAIISANPDVQEKMTPLVYPFRAYAAIYYYYYINHIFDVNAYVTFLDWYNSTYPQEIHAVLQANWYNDYFTTALPYRQRGSASLVNLPLSSANIVLNPGQFSFDGFRAVDNTPVSLKNFYTFGGDLSSIRDHSSGHVTYVATDLSVPEPAHPAHGFVKYDSAFHTLSYRGSADIQSSDLSFSIDQFREALILQQYMELNARGAEFYVDFIRRNFGVSTGDGRYNMPEYLGSTHSLIYFNEVTNLSAGSSQDSYLGKKSTIGRGTKSDFIAKFRVPEYGLIMGLAVVRPKNAYYGGINRQWLRSVNTDFYVPSFAHLPFQEIYNSELNARLSPIDGAKTFGYQGHWDEMRFKQDMVTAVYDKYKPAGTYHRSFSGVPKLGLEFLKCEVQNDNFIFKDEPSFFLEVYNQISAVRPLPAYSEPLEI